jgi:hypothetical protein
MADHYYFTLRVLSPTAPTLWLLHDAAHALEQVPHRPGTTPDSQLLSKSVGITGSRTPPSSPSCSNSGGGSFASVCPM